jgi:hypothetical protein
LLAWYRDLGSLAQFDLVAEALEALARLRVIRSYAAIEWSKASPWRGNVAVGGGGVDRVE